MANQAEDPAAPSAQTVGNAFTQQYYLTLHKSPDVVHKFYVDSSVLSRPGPDGVMTSVSTKQGIKEMILSLDFQSYDAQILTADAQYSHNNGVIVLVTGCLIGNNNERRKFAQTFFLSFQGESYFVLNDVFRYIEDEISNTDDVNSPTHPLAPTVESSTVADELMPSEITSEEVEISNDGNQVGEVVDNHDEGLVSIEIVEAEQNGHAEEKVLAVNSVESNQNVARTITEAAVSNPEEDPAPKKSFASVVNALNKNSAPFHVRATLPKPVEKPRAPVVPEAPKAYAIFVANLPMSATVEELDKIFKQFGPIKQDGIQVRSSKQQGTCFGFVEFESASSMQSALEASPIVFANRKLSIEERRANNDRAKFGRSGYRNDNFRRGRENYNGNRGFGRNEFEKRGEFSGRARGNAGRSGDQRSYSNGGDKVAQQGVKVA
ncbi:Splicing factor-like protein [Trema orientale]|uniref:Splicing factor-like protein n=1 Tax=Trema orientale TaxID=63057 RepID=A0A2P5CUB4_TREOI|nr:Splicing factor-like protein [Trema orientale]